MTQPMRNTIKDFPEQLRPRERLKRDAARSLSDYELLAILIQSGSVQMNVLETAQEILRISGGLHGLKDMNRQELMQVPGIGEGKAAIILSMVELSKRMALDDQGRELAVITSPLDAARIFCNNHARPNQEVFQVIYLDTKLKVITCEEVFVGTLDCSLVHLRDIFRNAVRFSARTLIVGHNHPSGDVRPSEQDRHLTKRLVEAGNLMDIPVQDHIIVSDRSDKLYFSFREEQLI